MNRLASFRLIPQLDTYPKVVDFAETAPGKIVMLAVFAAGLASYTNNWLSISIFLTAMTFLPQFRAILLTVATLANLYLANWPSASIPWPISELNYPVGVFFRPLIVGAVFASFAVYYWTVKKHRSAWHAKRPVRNLLIFYLVLLILATEVPLANGQAVWLWTFLSALGQYLWYFNYALLDRQAKETSPLALQAGHFMPFWGGSNTPFPKGAAYLRKIAAKTPRQLAVCQLKGIKLLAWALLLNILQKALAQICYGPGGGSEALFGIPFSLGIPTFYAVTHENAGHSYPWHLNWLALMANFSTRMLWFSVWGHVIIATCRMAGYNALRNTYKPLQSTSIADFWNRYYYYFKELLVENFFYPAFLRYFKKSPKLRLFFATMAAAGFGNVLYHFLQEINTIIDKGFWPALVSFHVYIFYGVLLGTAIGLSQLYEKKKAKDMSWLTKNLIKPLSIIGFYCLLSIFDNPDRELNLADYGIFFLKLFNIHLS